MIVKIFYLAPPIIIKCLGNCMQYDVNVQVLSSFNYGCNIRVFSEISSKEIVSLLISHSSTVYSTVAIIKFSLNFAESTTLM